MADVLYYGTQTLMVELSQYNLCLTRICGVLVKVNNMTILLANVYMPTDTVCDQQNYLEYTSVLQEIVNMRDNLNAQHLIIGGDFNTDPTRLNSLHTKGLNDVLHKNKLLSWLTSEFCTAKYSFESKINGSRSLLDHFVMSEMLFKQLYKADALHCGDNLSDHSAITISIDIPVEFVLENESNKYYINNKCPLWHKMSNKHLNKYQEAINSLINIRDDCGILCRNMECTEVSHLNDIDKLSDHLVQICLHAAEKSIPCATTDKKVKVIPGWNTNVENSRKDAIFWHAVWKSCGSPNAGVVADLRRKTRLMYHKAVKQCKRDKGRMISESMALSLKNSKYTKFWNTVKQHTRVKSGVPSSIDGVSGETNIASIFAKKYSNLYTSAPYDATNMMRIDAKIAELVSKKCVVGACDNDHMINKSDVVAGIKQLKCNKSDGNEGLLSNHLIY